jgi:hypothetical protein
MEPLTIISAGVAQSAFRAEAWSALPDAPVVPHVDKVSLVERATRTLGRIRTSPRKVAWRESPCKPSQTVSA